MSTGVYQPVQGRTDLSNAQFVRSSLPGYTETKGVYLTDGGRSIDLEPYTLLAKRASSGKYRAFVNEAATNGEAIPAGIYFGPTIAAADIVAGDVPNLVVITAGIKFDEGLLVIENAKTLETVIGTGTIHARTVRDYLRSYMLIPVPTLQHSGGENPAV
jgi:hypothetical protein